MDSTSRYATLAKRVGELMRAHSISGVSRRCGFVVTTRHDPAKPGKAPDLMQRQFFPDGPDRLWVADMTYVSTWEGFSFLANMLDVWNRRILGWAIAEKMTAELVPVALNMALKRRRAKDAGAQDA